MLLEQTAIEIFKETGVLQEGHFRLTSGLHSAQYMQCARLFQYADKAGIFCEALARLFADDRVDIVVGPAVGAVQMAFEVSRHLAVRNMFAEREAGIMTFRRGFAIEPGQRVLVVEDAITTGGSVREVMAAVAKAGGLVIGVGAIVDRSGGKADFGVPLRACVQVSIPTYAPAECPLCRDGLPIVKPGSRLTP